MLPIHPTAPEQFRQRNQLLQRCLRPDPLPFPIEEEYPIVLAPEGRAFSYCSYQGNTLCSHVNLWPRRVLDGQGKEILRVGLVGNVATDASLRGHGHMRSLLMEVEEEATRLGLSALILWSDLDQFYHKLAYQSLGREFRFTFHADDLSESLRTEKKRLDAGALDETLLASLLELRHPVPLTLERSPAEFQRLLLIPWLGLYVATEAGRLMAYALMGKGYDMAGIVHEWGAASPAHALELLAFICTENDFAQTMLLCPGSLPADWQASFQSQAAACEEMPMALMKELGTQRDRKLDTLFVWGLDSI